MCFYKNLILFINFINKANSSALTFLYHNSEESQKSNNSAGEDRSIQHTNLHSMAGFALFRGAIFKEYFPKKHFNTLFKYRGICIIYFLYFLKMILTLYGKEVYIARSNEGSFCLRWLVLSLYLN